MEQGPEIKSYIGFEQACLCWRVSRVESLIRSSGLEEGVETQTAS